jgi:hypothetical protein
MLSMNLPLRRDTDFTLATAPVEKYSPPPPPKRSGYLVMTLFAVMKVIELINYAQVSTMFEFRDHISPGTGAIVCREH